MTAPQPAARKKSTALPRPTSVSGARPLERPPGVEFVDDTWLEVDDVHIEALAADDESARKTLTALDIATLAERHAAELAAMQLDCQTRLAALERERDAALERVTTLEALLARQTAGLPPPLPSPTGSAPSAAERTPPAREVPTPNIALHDATPREPSLNSPIPTPVTATARAVPTLSDVLVATDIHDEAGAERRSTPRLARQFELEFNYETHFYAGLSLDISSGGLFIATYHLLPVGTLLWLSFSLPDETRLSVQGEVRWVRSSDEEHERPGMGVAFKELSAEALSKISAYCAERPPLYIDL